MAKKKGFEDFPDQPVDLSDFPDQPEPGVLKQAWDWANTPLWTAPAEKGKEISEAIGPGYVGLAEAEDPGKLFQHQIKEFLAGIPQGIGDVISGFTTPLNLATGAAFGGAGMAARGGLGLTSKVIPRAAALFTPRPTVAKGLQNIGRTLSAPIVAHGATQTFGPDKSLSERAFGLVEMAGGGIGLKAPRFPVSRTTVGTTGKPRTPVTPESVRRAKSVIETSQGNLKRIAGMGDEEIVSYAEQLNPEWKPTLEEPVIKKGKDTPEVTVQEEVPEVVLSSDGKLINVKTGDVLGEVPGAVKPPSEIKPPIKPPVSTKTGEVLPPNVPPTSDVIPPPTEPPPGVMPPASPEFVESTTPVTTPDITKEYPLTGDFIQQQHLRAWLNSSDKEIKEVAESLIRRRTDQPNMPPQPGEDLILAEYERRGLKPESIAEQLMVQHGEEFNPFEVTTKPNVEQGYTPEAQTRQMIELTKEGMPTTQEGMAQRLELERRKTAGVSPTGVERRLVDQMEAEGLLQKPGVEQEVNQALEQVQQESLSNEPQFERISRTPRYQELKRQQDLAYRAGNTEEAVRLGQQMQRMDELEKRLSVNDRRYLGIKEREPYDSIRNDEPTFSRVGDRIQPDEWRRLPNDKFEVFNTNTDEVIDYWPTEDLARRAVEKRYRMGRPEFDYRPIPEGTPGKVIPFNPNEEPSFAKVQGGGLTASVNIGRAVENITKDYTSPLPGIMNREGMQNGLDAADLLGANGEVKVRLSYLDETLEIYDNGAGLDEDALSNKLVEIFSTGKKGEAGATGGKGIGSASYIYGGKHFEIKTVAVDKIDGVKYEITASGTPEQFLDSITGSNWEKIPVPDETPTGTTIKVTLKDEHLLADAESMFDKIIENSRNRPSRVMIDKLNHTSKIPLKDIQPNGKEVTEHRFTNSTDDKLIGEFTTTNRNSDVKILIPEGPTQSRNQVDVHYLNNGMYQFTDSMHLGGMADDVPEKILVDIHPLVDDQHENYPFINTREDIKRDIREEVSKYIKDNVTSPALTKRKNRVQELYDSMSVVPITGTARKPIIFDPGNRLTSQEMTAFVNTPVVQQLVKYYDSLLDDILRSVGRQAWIDRLEGVGLVLDPNMHGVHIPNPDTGKSTILINPFIRIVDNPDPISSSWDNTITNLHEAAHIGSEHGNPIQLHPSDLTDPRLGQFLTSYMNQLVKHGDIGLWTNTGHGMAFAHRLGEIYAKFGVERTFQAAQQIQSIVTGRTGGYSSEIQRILQLYTESRGRTAVTEDLLSPTGTKSENRGRGSERNISGNTQTGGNGTPSNRPPTITVKEPTPAKVEMLKQLGYIPAGRGPDGYPIMKLGTPQEVAPKGKLPKVLVPFKEDIQVKNPTQAVIKRLKEQGFQLKGLNPDGTATFKYVKTEQPKKASFMRELFNLPRGLTTTADISAPMRQGLPLIATKAWWTSWDDMFKALGSEQAYQNVISDIEGKELFKPRFNPRTGTVEKSFAAEAGIKLSDLKALGNREESIMSTWVENIPGFGKIARGSNRAYTAFLNKLRADTFESLIMDAERMGLDPRKNMVLASEIADFVNTATGRGPMRTAIPTIGEKGKGIISLKERDIERHAELLTNALFSPRLVASRVRMLNPGTYIMASPFVRKQYLKALLSTAAAWSTFAGLMYGVGAEVSFDTNSADFGKVRFGNTRLDPAGGFQQYLVAISRFASGKTTSSASGREFELGKGYKAETRWSVAERFAVNKLHPVWKFGYDLFTASQYKPFNLFDRTAQLFVPLIVQDAVEIAQDDPTLLPLLAPVATGMGTQTYEKGSSDAKFTPFLGIEDLDVTFGGGGYQ